MKIAQCQELLSDPQRRRIYDRFGAVSNEQMAAVGPPCGIHQH